MMRESFAEQGNSLLNLAKAFLAKALLVQRVTAKQVVFESAGGPDAKLGATFGVDAVADGEDRIQVVVFDLADHLPFSFELNCGIFCRGCLPPQLAGLEDVTQMLADHGLIAAEELCGATEPNGRSTTQHVVCAFM